MDLRNINLMFEVVLLLAAMLISCTAANNLTQLNDDDLLLQLPQSSSLLSSPNPPTPSPAPPLSSSSSLEEIRKSSKSLSRKKRYIAFPEGSSFSVAVCFTIGLYGNPNYQFVSWALNWGVAYELPNETLANHHLIIREAQMPKPVIQRQNRRDLYSKMELAMDDMGYNGRECILRAICETSQFFKKKGENLVEEMLRTVFSMPKTKVLPFEHPDLHYYDGAYKRGLSKSYCSSYYPKCSFSLIDMALGRYSNPDLQFMKK